MKKYLVGLLLLSIFLASCQSKPTTISEDESATGTVVSTGTEGYSIKDGYLWKGENKLVATGEEISFAEEEPSIWNDFTDSGYLYIFLDGAAGCEGCVWFSQTYFKIDTSTESVEVKKFDDASFFDRGTPELAQLSPDKKKVLFVKTMNQFEGDALLREESVLVYDLLIGKEEKISDISKDETVLSCLDWYCALDDAKIFWKDSTTPVVQPEQKPEVAFQEIMASHPDLVEMCPHKDKCDYSVKFYGFERSKDLSFGEEDNRQGYIIYNDADKMVMENNLSDSRFVSSYVLEEVDFNNDGMDEYFLYYNDFESPPKTGNPGDNVKVFRRTDSGWVTDFALNEIACGPCDDQAKISEDTIKYTLDSEDPAQYKRNGVLVKIENTTNAAHQNYEYIYLKWDGIKVSPISYTETDLPAELQNL